MPKRPRKMPRKRHPRRNKQTKMLWIGLGNAFERITWIVYRCTFLVQRIPFTIKMKHNKKGRPDIRNIVLKLMFTLSIDGKRMFGMTIFRN